jgi:hypothetical protein
VQYFCEDAIPHIEIVCTHYEGTSTEELLRLLVGLVELEKLLRCEASVQLIDRVSEKLVVRLYNPTRLCAKRVVRGWESET